MPKLQIWTEAYRPFRIGGDLRQPIACIVEALGPFDLGSGYQGFLVAKPNGETVVAESKTGALVGPSLEEVRADIKTADKKVMADQIAYAKKQVSKCQLIPANDFWAMMRH